MTKLTDSSNQYAKRLQRLGLSENPFLPYRDGRYFFPLTDQQLAYQEILSLIAEKPIKNIFALIGARKMGKSAIARWVYETANTDTDLRTFTIFFDTDTVSLTPAKMVKIIFASLGIEDFPTKHKDRMNMLSEFLEEQMLKHFRSLFIIVDGDLSADALTTLKEMANWNVEFSTTTSPRKGKIVSRSMVQMALFGNFNVSYSPQKEIPSLFPWATVRTLALPLIQELANLLDLQTKRAGRSTPLFTEPAVDILLEQSERVPGVFIELANRAFHKLVASNETTLTEQIVRAALSEPPVEEGEDASPLVGQPIRETLDEEGGME